MKTELLNDLRAAAESTSVDKNGIKWGCVYLDNAIKGRSRHSFAGQLSGLEKDGLYQKENSSTHGGLFGYVKM